MIPLSVVNQGRYDAFTTVTVDSDRLVTLNLRDYFLNKIGRLPKSNESIRFIILDYVDIVSTKCDYKVHQDSSAVYARPTDFTKDNKIVIENYGKILGRGGNGRSQMTATTSALGNERGVYQHRPPVESHGGHGITNESPATIHLINYGTLAGGGGGGGAIAYISHRNGDWFWSTPIEWWGQRTFGGGGGGVPYGKGGNNAARLEDFLEGTYANVMTDQEKIKTVIRISKPGTVGIRNTYPGPKVMLFDLLDTVNTQQTVPLVYHVNNFLPDDLRLLSEVKSPAGSAHRQFYNAEIEGPDKSRIYFDKSMYSIKNGGSKYTGSQTLYTIGAPKFKGGNATMTAVGAAGYAYTEDITSRTSIRKGYIPAYGGIGGQIGKCGGEATQYGDIKLRNINNGAITKKISQLVAEGVKIFCDSDFLGYDNADHGNPGYLTSGNVIIENKNAAKTLGRIDVLNMADVFKQFGAISAARYFDITVTRKADAGSSYMISKVTMRDLLNSNVAVNVPTYEEGWYGGGLGYLFFTTTLSKVTLSRSTHLPAGNDSYLVLNDYGEHVDDVLQTAIVTSSTIEIGGIAHIGHTEAATTNPDLKSARVVLIAAPAAVITKIRDYIAGLKLEKYARYKHTSELY